MKKTEKRLTDTLYIFDLDVQSALNPWTSPISESSIAGDPKKIKFHLFAYQMTALFSESISYEESKIC